MADVKWIRLSVDMFDNRKIKYLRSLPEGNNIILIWVMLLTIAGRCNSNGMLFLTANVPYTTKMLADELGFSENIVVIAIKALETLGMIEYYDEKLLIAGWEEHQNADGLEKIRENNRIRQARYKEKQKSLTNNVSVTLPVTLGNALEEEKELELEKEIEEEKEKELNNLGTKVPCKQIVDLFTQYCPSYPTIRTLSDKRKKAINARLKKYCLEDIISAFEKAESSDFLKGQNNRNWSADFDWIMSDSNLAKVLEGKYDNKSAAKVTGGIDWDKI